MRSEGAPLVDDIVLTLATNTKMTSTFAYSAMMVPSQLVLMVICKQNKPEGRTASAIRQVRGVCGRIMAVAGLPSVREAVLSEDSIFSQVRYRHCISYNHNLFLGTCSNGPHSCQDSGIFWFPCHT